MRLLSYTIGEINSKWIYYLSIRPETIKLLVGEGVVERKDAGDKLLDTGFGNFFFLMDLTGKAKATKGQINK